MTTSGTYYFYDPNHGNCLRILHQIDSHTYIINGGYGSDEGKKGHWAAVLQKKSPFQYKGETYNSTIDFSMKKRNIINLFTMLIGQTEKSNGKMEIHGYNCISNKIQNYQNN